VGAFLSLLRRKFMTKFLSVVLMLFGFTMVAVDTADAARFGGGRSIGRFRQTIKPPVQRTAPAPQKANTATPQPQKSGMSRWLGPLAGLAIGAGLASLFMNNGIAGVLAGILMVLALVMGAAFLVRFFMRGKTQQQSRPLQYAGAGNDRSADPPSTQSTSPAQFSGNAAPGSLAATVGGASVAAT
jgi:predicted lipid-binding transport protein (Tim44 family)